MKRQRWTRHFPWVFLLAVAAMIPGACARSSGPAPAETPGSADTTAVAVATSAPAIWERVVVLGASASAGFNTKESLGEDLPLARVVDRMIRRKHEPVVDASTSYFFASPKVWAENKAAKAKKADPSMVIALDFLFWFGYGVKESEEARLTDLEEGFAHLEEFDCPVLISLIPDMRQSVGKMLFANQVPAPERIEALNARIREWAASRENVIVVPMVSFLEEIREGKAVRVGEARWPARAKFLLLQEDDLHPTVEGLAALAQLSLHTAVTRLAGTPDNAFDLADPLAVASEYRDR